MEASTNGSLDNSNVSNLFGDGQGVDAPVNSEAFGSLDPSFDFGSLLRTHDMSGESLSNSLLNQGFEGLCTPLDTVKWESAQSNLDGSGPTELVTGPNNQRQHNAVVSALGQHTIFSPIPSNNTAINTTPNNISAQFPRQYLTRQPSLLRNEYLPEFATGTHSSIMASHGHPQHFTSPSRYVLRTPMGQLPPQGLQPFDESHLRTSTHHAHGYNTIHQLGYRPTNQMSQNPLQSIYPDPQRYAHSPGQSSYGIPRQHYATGQSQQLATAPPSTPPNLIASYERNDHSSPGISAASGRSISIKREASISESPVAKPQPRKKTCRKTVKRPITIDDDGLSFTKSDVEYIEDLLDAMNDATEAEDNPGMQNTWLKIRDSKEAMVREKCVELLDLLKRAQREQLGDKKAVNPYPNFDHRFEETCAALRTQKTVCKHLMEPPYSHTVVNDPTYAAQRVRNNRRVNGQKRQAINMGRQALGLQGQGKGRGMKKIDGVTQAATLDGESSGEDPFADEDDSISTPEPPSKRQTSSRKKVKKTRRTKSDDDYEDDMNYTPAPKKTKRARRSAYEIRYDGPAANTSKPSDRSNEYRSITSSSPVQRLEPIGHQRGTHQSNYLPTEHGYGHTTLSLPSPRSMLPEFWNSSYQHSFQSDPFANQPSGFSSSPNPDFNNSDQLNSEHDTNIHGHRLELKPFGQRESSD